jgi:3-methyladenine DNA glycosylase AlkD
LKKFNESGTQNQAVMNKSAEEILALLKNHAREEKVAVLSSFFKTGPGEYAEGDVLWGVSVPEQRKIAKKHYSHISETVLSELLHQAVHEGRLTALLMLVHKFEKAADGKEAEGWVRFYLQHKAFVNNWDLVDTSSHKILGPWFFQRDRQPIYELADSAQLWDIRIAIICTYYFIRRGDFRDTLRFARQHLHHHHDLIHKALGWMLREVGKMDQQILFDFLRENYKKMPRTMLRYAIERFEEPLRQDFLKGRV